MDGVHFIQDLAIILAAAAGLGWLCQRLGLSAVVGYLVAGILVGPNTPPFSFVRDEASIATAAQVGLVFLMFSIGLRLSLRRLKRLGAGLLLAVFCSAGLIYFATRGLGAAAGLDATQTLFLAGMLMVSSSAIIGKVLHETGTAHERPAQLAMGVTVLEDVVAVVMLTVLNSVATLGGAGGAGAAGGASLGATIGGFGAFVVFAGVLGLLIVPWLLRRLSLKADEELQTLATAALLFGLAVTAHRAGYSLALGAFLLGTIVAETPHRHQVERIFEGMRDVFSAVFFVAIGLQMDVKALAGAWAPILGLAVFTVAVRAAAVATGLTLIGARQRDALRAGLVATPLGEFSFVIAQLGVASLAVPPVYYPVAVGLSLATSLTAPFLTRRSEAVAGALLKRQPDWLARGAEAYRGWLEALHERREGSVLWRLSRKRVIQIVVELLFVAGLLVSAEPLERVASEAIGAGGLVTPGGARALFWCGLVLVALGPLYAAWRNVSALALMVAETVAREQPAEARERTGALIAGGARLAALAGLAVWVASFAPTGAGLWALAAGAAVVVTALAVLRRRLVYWHSELEVELQDILGEGGAQRLSTTTVPWLGRGEEWRLDVSECVVPDLAACAGQTLARLDLRARHGCTVVGIERQGCMIPLPGPECALYPRDRVLFVGAPGASAGAKAALGAVQAGPEAGSDFDLVGLDAVLVGAGGRGDGATLAELAPSGRHRVQVVALRRDGVRVIGPKADARLVVGDELLLLGTPSHLAAFKAWLREARG